MQLTRFRSARDFLARAEAFLVEHEAEHCLPLGLSTSLAANPNLYPSQPYFGEVEDMGKVVAAGIMTPPYRLVLSLTESREALELIARDVQEFRPDTPGVIGPVPVSHHFAEIWQALTGQAFHRRMAERIYKLESVKPPSGVSGQMRRATADDRALLTEWLIAFQKEAFEGDEVDMPAVERTVKNMLTLPPDMTGVYLWEDPQPVSLTRYGGPTPHGMRIGPVYTPPEFRGRGYASACVAGVSQYLLDSGRSFCFLFTDLANPTSNHIYQVIGYEPVCDVDEYRFANGRFA